MRVFTFCLLVTSILMGCSKKKIEITNSYIINENWNKRNDKNWENKIEIYKLKVKKDSTINPLFELSQGELLSKLEVDSTFFRFAAISIGEGKDYSTQPIYFNKYNGFYWDTREWPNNRDSVATIGELQQGNWYRFSDLGIQAHPYFIYIYIDSLNKSHRFDVNLSNY